MRKLAFAVAVLFLVGLTSALAAETKGKTHQVSTEVVSVDLDAKTITIKGEDGQDKTAPVKGSGLEDLKKVKAGDKVLVTCQDSETGEHEAIIAIKPAKA